MSDHYGKIEAAYERKAISYMQVMLNVGLVEELRSYVEATKAAYPLLTRKQIAATLVEALHASDTKAMAELIMAERSRGRRVKL